MNVEKTMEFMLQHQAKAEAQMSAMREHQIKADAQLDAILLQQAKAEGQMAAIRKLIQTGMRMIVKQGEQIQEVAVVQKDLAKSQKLTDTKLQGLIDALRRGRNGSHSKN